MNAKRKGNEGQAKFAAFLQSHGFRAMSDGSRSGGGTFKGDIHNDQDICYEVKTVSGINLQEAWRQVSGDTAQSRAMPVLAIHFDGMAPGSWLMVMASDDWIEFLKGKESKEQNYKDPKFEWALKGLGESVKRVVKFLPE